jgi:hypothetical protein
VDFTLVITPPGAAAQPPVTFSADSDLKGVHHLPNPTLTPKIDLGRTASANGTKPTWSFQLKKSAAADFRSLTAADLDDLVFIVRYEVS